MTEPKTAAAITKASKSNLALAFVALPPERRQDITTFYAFCRLVDDIADDTALPIDEKRRRIGLWRESLLDTFAGEPPLAAAVREIIRKYMIEPALFTTVLDGVEMDLNPRRYETFEELDGYCYHVAGAVGLVSIEIFGYRNQACKEYALALGTALQLTNILRDVKNDAQRGRIYLPLSELARCGVTEAEILAGQYSERYHALAVSVAARARHYYQLARQTLPPAERRNMVAAELMGTVYWQLLLKLEAHQFNVFGAQRISLSKARKISLVLNSWLGHLAGAGHSPYGTP